MKKFWWMTGAMASAVALWAVSRAVGASDQPQPAPAASAADAQTAYLGLMTAPVPDALRHQLDLNTDAGVLVAQVDPQGALKGVLEPFDVLLKIDDQWIWNQDQVQGLIRMRAPGDGIALTYLHKSREQTAKVKLQGRAHAAPAAIMCPQIPMPHVDIEPMPMPIPLPELLPVQPRPMRMGPGGPAGQVQTETHVSFMLSEADDHGQYSLRMRDGRQTFSVKDADGNQVFEGPVNGDEEIGKVPAEYQPKLRELQGRAPKTQIRQITVPGGSSIQIQQLPPAPQTGPEEEGSPGAPM